MPLKTASPDILDRILFWSTLLLGLGPALLFAGRPLWVIMPAAIACGALLSLAATQRLRRPASGWTLNGGLMAGAGAIWLAVIAYALAQGTLTFSSGGLWAETSALTGQDVPSRRSFNPGATLNGAVRLSLYGGVCLLAFWTCRGHRQGWMLLRAVAAIATLAAVYAIIGRVLGWETVLWREKLYYAGFATGPFENRNTFATFLAIGLAANTALFARSIRNAAIHELEGAEKFRQALDFGTRQGILLALPMLAILAAGLMTGSRAGFAAIALAITITALTITIRWAAGRSRVRVLGVLAIIVAVLGGLWLLGGGQTAERAANLEASATVRLELYNDTSRAIAKGPSGGYGLGAFPEAIHAYKSSMLVNDWRRAHNSYLELALEVGWPVAVAAFLAVALVAVAAARGIWTRYRSAPISAAATAGVVAAALHSLVDFPLQEPGIAMTLALLLGAAAAQADGRNQSAQSGGG